MPIKIEQPIQPINRLFLEQKEDKIEVNVNCSNSTCHKRMPGYEHFSLNSCEPENLTVFSSPFQCNAPSSKHKTNIANIYSND